MGEEKRMGLGGRGEIVYLIGTCTHVEEEGERRIYCRYDAPRI